MFQSQWSLTEAHHTTVSQQLLSIANLKQLQATHTTHATKITSKYNKKLLSTILQQFSYVGAYPRPQMSLLQFAF